MVCNLNISNTHKHLTIKNNAINCQGMIKQKATLKNTGQTLLLKNVLSLFPFLCRESPDELLCSTFVDKDLFILQLLKTPNIHMFGKKLLFLLLMLLPFGLFAATFTVTTTADNGPGSLREALLNALNNGTAETDSIVFEIIDVSVPGRTIEINSVLPAIGANTVINGITQPGLSFGLSDARIKIEPGPSFPSAANMFTVLTGANNVEIYGIILTGNSSNHPAIVNTGIAISNSTNIKIGTTGMGNLVTGFNTGILFSGAVSQNVSISHNILGLNDTTNITNIYETNEISIDAENTYNLAINSNVMYGTINTFKFNTNVHGIEGALSLINNKVGTDIFGFALKTYPAIQSPQLIYISGNSTNAEYDSIALFSIDIRNNIVTGNANTGVYLGNGLTNVQLIFKNNIVGSDISVNSIPNKLSTGVYVGYVGRPWGSSQLPPADFSNNQILFCNVAGANQDNCYIYFNSNKFYCNKDGIINNSPSDNIIKITSVTQSTIKGICPPGEMTIDLYVAYNCSGSCQGYTKMTSFIKSGPDTTWSYCGFLQGNIVALCSYAGNNYYSSSFSNCVTSTNKPIITQATCKNKIGSISGINIPPSASIIWRNINGDSITNTLNLNNVVPGRYFYEVTSSECNYFSDTFSINITGYPFLVATAAKVFPEICGGDGAIQYIRANASDGIRWVDTSGNVVGNAATLANVPAGKYKMFVGKDSGCIVSTNWYTVVDTTTRIDSNAIIITRDTCNKMSGSITYNNVFPADYLFWWNDPNGVAMDTNTYRIDTLAPGNYTLSIQRVNYDSTCTSTYGPYNVVKVPGISFDTSNINITNASCSQSNGAISNIAINDAKGNVNYQWVDSTGKAVGNGINLGNIPGGRYRLQCKDESGCDTFYSAYFTVLNEGVITIDTSNLLVKAASCKGPDGFIRNITATNTTSYQWIDANTNTNVTNTINLDNAATGNYQLILNNSFNCQTQTNVINVPQSVFDTIAVTNSQKDDAHCNKTDGYINLTQFSKDTLLYTFEWLDNAGNAFSTLKQISNLDSGTYRFSATDSNGCKGNIYTATIIQTGVPGINNTGELITNDSCSLGKGSIYNVNAQGGGGQYTWQWYNTKSQQLISTSKPLTGVHAGNYYVVISDQYNCIDTSNVYTINNTDVVLPLPLAPDVNILRGSAASIKVKNLITGMYFLYDNPSSTTAIDSSRSGVLKTPVLNNDATFYIRVQSGSCYSDYGPAKVFVFDKSSLVIPNAFSPNGDGINDTWVITQIGIVYLDNLTVFNRWGQAVYTTKDFNTAWNGTMNGKPLPIGTYYYTVQAKDLDGRQFKQSGYITILR